MMRREFLETAAAVAGAATGDVPDVDVNQQQQRLRELADRSEDERWEYETSVNLAHVDAGFVYAELDAAYEQPAGSAEIHAISTGGVPIEFNVEGDQGESIGTLVHLSADQAEAFAVDLLEQAHAARKASDADQ